MPVAAAADPSYPAGVKVPVTFQSLYGAMLIASMANMLWVLSSDITGPYANVICLNFPIVFMVLPR